jgi:hypothetical protein
MANDDESFSAHALSISDREIIAQGLSALLRERSQAYVVCSKVARSKGQCLPDVQDFGLSEILRLSRTIRYNRPTMTDLDRIDG